MKTLIRSLQKAPALISRAQTILRKTVLTFVVTLSVTLLVAQGSYFRFGIGYGLPASSQLLGENQSYYSSPSSYSSNEKGIYGSLGTGLVFSASYGHTYTKNFGLDFSLQYLAGKKYESNHTSTYVDYNGTTTSTHESSIRAQGFLVSPSLVFSIAEGSLRPYTKIGLVIGSMKFGVEDESNYANQTLETKTEFKGGLSLGFRGGAGLDFATSKKANFFIEVMFTSLTYYPHESEVTKFLLNGIDQPDQRKKITYEKEVNMTNLSDGNQQLRFAAPFGSIALNVGLKLNIGQRAEVKPKRSN